MRSCCTHVSHPPAIFGKRTDDQRVGEARAARACRRSICAGLGLFALVSSAAAGQGWLRQLGADRLPVQTEYLVTPTDLHFAVHVHGRLVTASATEVTWPAPGGARLLTLASEGTWLNAGEPVALLWVFAPAGVGDRIDTSLTGAAWLGHGLVGAGLVGAGLIDAGLMDEGLMDAAWLESGPAASNAVRAAQAAAHDSAVSMRPYLVALPAPSAGVVRHAHPDLDERERRQLTSGDVIRYGQAIVWLLDPAEVSLVGVVDEVQRRMLTDGAPAEVRFAVAPGAVARGAVRAIVPVVPAAEADLLRSGARYRVELHVDASGLAVLPGDGAEVRISTGAAARALAVPRRCVFSERDQSFVFMRRGHGVVEATPVRLGRSDDIMVEVIAGLFPEDRVLLDVADEHLALLKCAKPVTEARGPRPPMRAVFDARRDSSGVSSESEG